MTTQKVKKVIIALRMDRMTPLQLVDFSKQIVTAMTGNAYFASPSPTLASINSNIVSLEAAIAVTKRGIQATTADMHAKKKILHDALKNLGAYVEGIANLDPPNAITIARSAEMGIKNDPKPRPSGFRLQLTGIPGQVRLYTTSIKSGSYRWEYTLTPTDNASWISVENNLAKILITGLTSGQRYYFRAAAVERTLGPWSTIINTVVA
jgi:hypothetical protein